MSRDKLHKEPGDERLRKLALEIERLEAEKNALEYENGVLLQRIQLLVEELARVQGTDRQQALNLEISKLQAQLVARNKERFGSRTERRPRPPGDQAEKTGDKPKQKGHGPTPQPDLPMVFCDHALDEAEMICPCCLSPVREMVGQTEDAEEITIVRGTYKLQVNRRKKYCCTVCGNIETALGPEKLIEGGRYSVEFAAQVAVDKYADHLPFERQVVRMQREGLVVTSQTLWDQLLAMYHLLLPTLLMLHKQLLREPLLHVDESSWRMMAGKGSQRWWIWSISCANAVFYMLCPTRGRAAAELLLSGFNGTVMADGYAVYAAMERKAGDAQLSLTGALAQVSGFVRAMCWAHARRPFWECEKNFPAAKEALDLIGRLYAVERKARTEADNADPPDPDNPAQDLRPGPALLEARRRLRDAESRPIVAQLRAWLDQQTALPTSVFGKALRFMGDQWVQLTRFLDDPNIPLDNTHAERTMRGPVLGRKNHYGSRSELGTRVAALFYSLIETCKLIGVNPYDYLVEATRRAIHDPGTVTLPADYAAEIAAKKKAQGSGD